MLPSHTYLVCGGSKSAMAVLPAPEQAGKVPGCAAAGRGGAICFLDCGGSQCGGEYSLPLPAEPLLGSPLDAGGNSWKGENVATTEVEKTLTTLDFIQEVSVYGVPVPGHEGKTGMAAIQLKGGLSFDGKGLYAHVKDYMPNYAVPRFIRIKESLETTETFKQRKVQLVKEGFDPNLINDPLYFLDDLEKCYVPMTQQIFSSIKEKKLKL